MKPLIDPKNDRKVKSAPAPPHRPLEMQLLYPPKLNGKTNPQLCSIFTGTPVDGWDGKLLTFIGKPDWKVLRDHLSKEGRLDKTTLKKVIADVMKIFSRCLN